MHVLFIGNSYTINNDLPAMIADLAEAAGDAPLQHDRQALGGQTLEGHWNEGRAQAKIRGGRWDRVVLQEHSRGALDRRDPMFAYARRFDDEIRSAGARTILYVTWAREGEPDRQQSITDAYVDLAQELGAGVAPVGVAWQKVRLQLPQVALHTEDGSHPTPAGTYLAACVFYGTLYDRPPVGLPAASAGLHEADSRALQEIAHEVVEEYRELAAGSGAGTTAVDGPLARHH